MKCCICAGLISVVSLRSKQKKKYLSDAELFKPCASTIKKKQVSSYLKPSKPINSLDHKEAVFSKPLFVVAVKLLLRRNTKKVLENTLHVKLG